MPMHASSLLIRIKKIIFKSEIGSKVFFQKRKPFKSVVFQKPINSKNHDPDRLKYSPEFAKSSLGNYQARGLDLRPGIKIILSIWPVRLSTRRKNNSRRPRQLDLRPVVKIIPRGLGMLRKGIPYPSSTFYF